jgi:hypothetical protein
MASLAPSGGHTPPRLNLGPLWGVQGSWDDLTTAGTPEFLYSKAGEILSTSPQHTTSFFLHTSYMRWGIDPIPH